MPNVDVAGLREWVIWLAGLIGALTVISIFINKVLNKIYEPINKLNDRIDKLEKQTSAELADNDKSLEKLGFEIKDWMKGNKEATALVLWRMLEGDYNYYMAKGEISLRDKHALMEMFQRYRDLGLNHLREGMEEDIKRLRTICSGNFKGAEDSD